MTTTKEYKMRDEFYMWWRKQPKDATAPIPPLKAWKACAESYENKLAEKDAEITHKDILLNTYCENLEIHKHQLSEANTEITRLQNKLMTANARNAMLVEVLLWCNEIIHTHGDDDRIDKAITANSEAVAAYEREVQAKVLEYVGEKWKKLHVFPDAAHILIEAAAELRAAKKGKE